MLTLLLLAAQVISGKFDGVFPPYVVVRGRFPNNQVYVHSIIKLLLLLLVESVH